jgi:hypothetical protein
VVSLRGGNSVWEWLAGSEPVSVFAAAGWSAGLPERWAPDREEGPDDSVGCSGAGWGIIICSGRLGGGGGAGGPEPEEVGLA